MICKWFILVFLILQLTSICPMMTKKLLQQDNQAAAAATYIPFIMNLIKPSLSRKEKFKLSQNVYNAFRRKQHEQEEEKVMKENEEKALRKNEEKLSKFYKNKPYYLRF